MDTIFKYFRYAAIIGNSIYILWIIHNAIDEGFSGRPLEIISLLGLTILLILNSVLLLRKKFNSK